MYFSLTKSMILFSLSLWSFQSFGQEKVINVLETNEPPAEIPIGSEGKEVFSIVDEPADFPGGPEAMRKYLSENIAYPERAFKNKIQGKCYIQFIVSDTGKIGNIVVKKGVPDCPECDAEAVKAIEKMPLWTPGKINGKGVYSLFSLPVSFKL